MLRKTHDVLPMAWDRLEVVGSEGIDVIRKDLDSFSLKYSSHVRLETQAWSLLKDSSARNSCALSPHGTLLSGCRLLVIMGGKISGVACVKYCRHVSLRARWSRLAGRGGSNELSIIEGGLSALDSDSLAIIDSGHPLSAQNGDLHCAFLHLGSCYYLKRKYGLIASSSRWFGWSGVAEFAVAGSEGTGSRSGFAWLAAETVAEVGSGLVGSSVLGVGCSSTHLASCLG